MASGVKPVTDPIIRAWPSCMVICASTNKADAAAKAKGFQYAEMEQMKADCDCTQYKKVADSEACVFGYKQFLACVHHEMGPWGDRCIEWRKKCVPIKKPE